jgi:hypothetical protein
MSNDVTDVVAFIEMKATQYLVKCAGIILLCQINSLMMAPRCRNMWEFYKSFILLNVFY